MIGRRTEVRWWYVFFSLEVFLSGLLAGIPCSVSFEYRVHFSRHLSRLGGQRERSTGSGDGGYRRWDSRSGLPSSLECLVCVREGLVCLLGLYRYTVEARRDSFVIAQKGSLRATGRATKDGTPSSMLLGGYLSLVGCLGRIHLEQIALVVCCQPMYVIKT